MKIRCWWFGCDRHPQDFSPPNQVSCMFCGECISYSDLVGDTRHYRFMNFLSKFSPRRLFPARCPDCGHRYKCDDKIDHIPF